MGQAAAQGAYAADKIWNITSALDGLAGAQAAVAMAAGWGITLNRTFAGWNAYNAMSPDNRAQFNYNYSKAVCAVLTPILANGAKCAPVACENNIWNICDQNTTTPGATGVAGGYIAQLSQIAKLNCARASTAALTFPYATTAMLTCEVLYPAANFGTYVAPTPSNSSNTTKAPGSSASSVEVGLLAAASVVVAVLAF